MTTELTRFTQGAKEKPQRRFTALMGLLAAVEGLADSFHRQPSRKAVGVDGVDKFAYAQKREANLADLSARLKRMGYRPKPSRRVYIPKTNGGKRPIGIPSFEDRLVEDRPSRILQGIWEPEFCECSYGFRPDRSAHEALARLDYIITMEKTQWLYEADLKNFFGSVSHKHLMRFIGHRIGDKNLLRLIRRFLKAGVLEDGATYAVEKGTPQGNLVSPVLSNIFLHYTLDVWFEQRFAKTCRGKAYLVRYAEWESDARAVEQALKERLTEFSLEVEPNKTALIRFGYTAPLLCKKDGRRRTARLNLLGFTHYMRVRKNGYIQLCRKTRAGRLRRSLSELGARLSRLRLQGQQAMQQHVLLHLRGHRECFGINGNARSLNEYFFQVERILFKWLNRRSQRQSFCWERYRPWLQSWYPEPRVIHALY